MYNLSVRRGQTIGAIRPGGGHVQRLRPLVVGLAERGLERPPSLDEEARPAFEPMAFFGSLTPERRDRLSDERPWRRGSFASVIWMYDAAVAGAVLAALAPDLAEAGAEMLASLGRHPMADEARRRLERPDVGVEGWVDQWGVLKDTDLCVTHHGLNSSHERSSTGCRCSPIRSSATSRTWRGAVRSSAWPFRWRTRPAGRSSRGR